MRTSTFLAAGAVVVPAALAGRSPVPASYGFNQAIMFTVNQVSIHSQAIANVSSLLASFNHPLALTKPPKLRN
jgi:hypothetical protein